MKILARNDINELASCEITAVKAGAGCMSLLVSQDAETLVSTIDFRYM